MILRTATIMVLCYGDSGEHFYHVLRGPMISPAVFDAHAAEHLATYRLVSGQEPNYAAMTAAHATLEAPPVRWQR